MCNARTAPRVGGVGVSPANRRISETRNGSNQATRQWVWGTQYVDEPVFMDVNLDPGVENDCDPDTTGTRENEQTHDRRYFYVQDGNWNVVALVESDDGVGTQGRIAERYSYTPYGEFVVLKGQTGSGNLGNVLPTSTVGNVFAHQGLPFDTEKGSYQNRRREYTRTAQRFATRDPLPTAPRAGSYLYAGATPVRAVDPRGLDWDPSLGPGDGLGPDGKIGPPEGAKPPDDPCSKSAPWSSDPNYANVKGQVVCDGKGGFIICTNTCKAGYSSSDCNHSQSPDAICPNPPQPNQCKGNAICNQLSAYCVCDHEKHHVRSLQAQHPDACRDQNGNPRPAGSVPDVRVPGDSEDEIQAQCWGLRDELDRLQESLTCFRDNGYGASCATEIQNQVRARIQEVAAEYQAKHCSSH